MGELLEVDEELRPQRLRAGDDDVDRIVVGRIGNVDEVLGPNSDADFPAGEPLNSECAAATASGIVILASPIAIVTLPSTISQRPLIRFIAGDPMNEATNMLAGLS